jgi:hypothetical protein
MGEFAAHAAHTIGRLDQIHRVAAALDVLLKDRVPVDRQRVHGEGIVLLRGDNLRVDGGQRLRDLRRRVANSLVRVHPAPARRNFQAVQIVITGDIMMNRGWKMSQL